MIPYGKHSIDQSDIDSVLQVLQSDWITQGPAVPRFESAVAEYCGAKHASATCNATSALHVSYLMLGVCPGDYVWTTPNTFVATSNSALSCGASIDFVDIDPATYNMCPRALEQKLKNARRTNTLPKVVVAVHFGGNPCDMEKISALADEYGFYVVEDASHAIGAEYKGSKIGSCRYSEATVFSFHPVKLMTTAEGGMILTNSDAFKQKADRLRSHGVSRDDVGSEGGWYYQQLELGFNYRMNDLQAALGLSQLRRLDSFVSQRKALAARYDNLLQHPSIACPTLTDGASSSWHLYVIRLLEGIDRKQVYNVMQEKGIGVNVHYIPVHTQPYYRNLGFASGDFPVAEQYYNQALTLPLYPDLTYEEQDYVIRSLFEAISLSQSG